MPSNLERKKGSNIKFGVDLDGVLCNFESGFAPLLTRLTGVKFPASSATFPDVWDWPRQHGVEEKYERVAWEMVAGDELFWQRLEPYPATSGAISRLRAARKDGHDIYFLTHRFGKKAKWQTENWLQEQGMANPTVILAEDKGSVATGIELDIFVDDKPSNLVTVAQASPFTRCYVFDRAYNRTEDLRGYPRVKTIQELLDIELLGKLFGPVVSAGAQS